MSRPKCKIVVDNCLGQRVPRLARAVPRLSQIVLRMQNCGWQLLGTACPKIVPSCPKTVPNCFEDAKLQLTAAWDSVSQDCPELCQDCRTVFGAFKKYRSSIATILRRSAEVWGQNQYFSSTRRKQAKRCHKALCTKWHVRKCVLQELRCSIFAGILISKVFPGSSPARAHFPCQIAPKLSRSSLNHVFLSQNWLFKLVVIMLRPVYCFWFRYWIGS